MKAAKMTQGDQEGVAKMNITLPPPRDLPPREALLPAGVPAFLGVQGAWPRLLLPEGDFRGRDRAMASRGGTQPAPASSLPLSLTLPRRAGIPGPSHPRRHSPRTSALLKEGTK